MSFRQFGLNVIIAVIISCIWEILVLVIGKEDFPHLPKVIFEFFNSFLFNQIIKSQGGGDQGFSIHVYATLKTHAVGFFIGSILGLLLGVLLPFFNIMKQKIDVLIELFRIVPPLIIVPFLLLLIGPINFSHYFIVTIYSCFSIFIYTLNASRKLDKNIFDLARLYNASWFFQNVELKLRLVFPHVIGGLRITAGSTLGILIVSEYLGAQIGLGRLLKSFGQFSRIDLIMVTILWCVIIVTILDIIVIILSLKLNSWSDREKMSRVTIQ